MLFCFSIFNFPFSIFFPVLDILHTIVQNGSGVVLPRCERGSGFCPALQAKLFWTTPTLWIAVEHRLFRPCGQHNQTDNRPTPTLWSVVEHRLFRPCGQHNQTDNRPTPTLWSVVEHRLFRPCGQHNQTDNRPTPTLWSVVEHDVILFYHFQLSIFNFLSRSGSRIRGRHMPCRTVFIVLLFTSHQLPVTFFTFWTPLCRMVPM